MSEEIPVPVSLRNIRIQQWVKETAAAQTNNRLSLWPQDTPRSLVDEARDFPGHIRENTLISSQHTVTQNSPRSPFCIAEDLSQDLDSGPEQGGSTRQQQDPDTPLLDNLTTPTTISPPNSALWPANLSLGRSIDKKDSPWDRLAQREKLMDCKPDDGECAVSGTSDKNTTVPPAPLCFRQERNEPCPRLDNLHQETESQRRKASYLLPLYSRPTSQPMDWNDGTDADRLREDIMTHGESSLLDQTVPLQIEESMGRRHFAQPQVIWVKQGNLARIPSGAVIDDTLSLAQRPRIASSHCASQMLVQSSKRAAGFLFRVTETDMESAMPESWNLDLDLSC